MLKPEKKTREEVAGNLASDFLSAQTDWRCGRCGASPVLEPIGDVISQRATVALMTLLIFIACPPLFIYPHHITLGPGILFMTLQVDEVCEAAKPRLSSSKEFLWF